MRDKSKILINLVSVKLIPTQSRVLITYLFQIYKNLKM